MGVCEGASPGKWFDEALRTLECRLLGFRFSLSKNAKVEISSKQIHPSDIRKSCTVNKDVLLHL